MYVGCSDIDVEGDWRWLDGTPGDSDWLWAPSEPAGGGSQNCGVLYPDGLHDVGCPILYHFICEVQEGKTLHDKVTYPIAP